jgi:flavin-dependent dehydrogenase
MINKFSPVGIIGAGPAGSHLAYLLARAGMKTILFTGSRIEKHCGGGIPARAFDEFPWLSSLPAPRNEITKMVLIAHDGTSCDLEITKPIRIFDRRALDKALRARAASAGAYIIPEKVRFLRGDGIAWRVATDNSEHRVGFLVGADGAASLVRRTLSTPLRPFALSLCAGYYLSPPEEERIFIYFPPRKASYIWIFPRQPLSSTGIVAPLRGADKNSLLSDLRLWLAHNFPRYTFDFSRPYAALVPSFPGRTGPVCGARWALAGDAAAVADPVTREGIYFSLKSSELLAASLLDDHPMNYAKTLPSFLRRHHRLALFLRRYLFSAFFTSRGIRLAKKKTVVRAVLERFFSESLSYGSLFMQMPYRKK